MVGRIGQHHGVGADTAVGTNVNRAQHFCARADHHMIAQGGVTLTPVAAGSAQGHSLVQQHVITNFGGFANHHPAAMIDQQVAADGGGGMNLNPRHHAGQVGQQLSGKMQPPSPQAVGHPIQQQGVQARVAQHHLQPTGGGGIAPPNRGYQGFLRHGGGGVVRQTGHGMGKSVGV